MNGKVNCLDDKLHDFFKSSNMYLRNHPMLEYSFEILSSLVIDSSYIVLSVFW